MDAFVVVVVISQPVAEISEPVVSLFASASVLLVSEPVVLS